MGALGTGGSKKRLKQKGIAHALRWDILDNEDIEGEEGWEVEMEEYWTSKTSKKYVKMYHVDKLWPRGCHEMNTKSFTARPHICNNDHFLHRAKEVWRTLFGDRQKNTRVLQLQLVVNGIHGAHIEEEGGLDLFSDDRTVSAEYWEESKAHSRFIQSTVNLDEGFVGRVEE